MPTPSEQARIEYDQIRAELAVVSPSGVVAEPLTSICGQGAWCLPPLNCSARGDALQAAALQAVVEDNDVICAGSGVGLPDLVPVPNAQGDFCNREGNNLIVTVANQGSAAAGPSTTRVNFSEHSQVDVAIPALAAGARVDLPVAIPPGCFDPDCEFSIVVDVNNVVTESNKANNSVIGRCLG